MLYINYPATFLKSVNCKVKKTEIQKYYIVIANATWSKSSWTDSMYKEVGSQVTSCLHLDLPFPIQKFLKHVRLYTRKMLLFTHEPD
jgi:hypothetical protein